jgi:hypoxanthine phosphoribosyltransferase
MSLTPLYSKEAIAARVEALAEKIAAHYAQVELDKPLLLIGLLRGSFVFVADLSRALYECGLEVEIDFLGLSSYGKGTETTGEVTVTRPFEADPHERHVLIVDDILESGLSLTCAIGMMCEKHAASVKTAVLLEKPGKRKVHIDADFVGFEIADHFVVGYGLDHAGLHRGLPYIGVVS